MRSVFSLLLAAALLAPGCTPDPPREREADMDTPLLPPEAFLDGTPMARTPPVEGKPVFEKPDRASVEPVEMDTTGLLFEYYARIAPRDRRASDGLPLEAPGLILQQDRANVYLTGRRDPGDRNDPLFADAAWRARIPDLLSAGGTTEPVLREIKNGGALVRVLVRGSEGEPQSMDALLVEPGE